MDYTLSLYRKDRFKELESLTKRPFSDLEGITDMLHFHLKEKVDSLRLLRPDMTLLPLLVNELLTEETVSRPGLLLGLGIMNVLLVVDGDIRHFTVTFIDQGEVKGSSSYVASFV